MSDTDLASDNADDLNAHVDRAAEKPSLELQIALAVTILPQLAAFLVGGYGRLAALTPLALTLALADAVALAIAGLQLRADRRATRDTHPLVWATIVLAGLWLGYAIYFAAVALFVQTFCINQLCRDPIHQLR